RRLGSAPLTAMVTASVLAASLPFGAWASSGMETAGVMLLCTLALVGCRDERAWGFVCAGVAAGLRPELVPWAVVFALLCPATSAKQRLRQTAIVLVFPFGVAVSRGVIFGSPAPLSLLAKPSDGAHGLAYAWGALRLLGVPLLW